MSLSSTQTFKPTPASLQTQIGNPHIQQARILLVFFSEHNCTPSGKKIVIRVQVVHPKCKVLGLGGRPFCPAHNRRSNRDQHTLPARWWRQPSRAQTSGCLYSLDWTTGLEYWTDLFCHWKSFLCSAIRLTYQ